MKLLAWTSALLAMLVLAACGGGGETPASSAAATPDEMEIAAVIDKYEQATKDHDAKLFCTEVISTDKSSPFGQDPKTCTVAIGRVMKDPTSGLSSAETIAVKSYDVKGKNATVQTELDGKAKKLTFFKGADGWRLAAFG